MLNFNRPRTAQSSALPRALFAFTFACASLGLSACSQELSLNLTEGQCVLLPDSSQIATVTTTDCSQEHHAEVIGTITLTTNELPTTTELDTQAREECEKKFETYVGIPTQKSVLEIKWFLPSATSWKTGDRTIACIAIAPNQQMLNSPIKGSGM